MNVLLIEDDSRVARFLEESFRGENHQTFLVRNFTELDDFLSAPIFSPQIIIMDRMLGNDDSIEKLSDVKKLNPQSAIIFLSAINSADEKAKALNLGADDYLSKPFSFTELIARVQAVTRRSSTTNSNANLIMQSGNVTLDQVSHQAFVSGQRLDLTNKELHILQVLMKRPGQIFSKFKLLDMVWDVQTEVESNVVESTIRNLRRKLETAKSEMTIHSKRNLGYWIES